MVKKEKYICPRCNFNSNDKSLIKRHFFTLKKICPATKNNIDLTDDIKNYILNNRIYIIPIDNTPKNNIINNNKICNDLSIIKNDISKLNKDLPVNNQLINIIIDKNKKLQELLNNETNNYETNCNKEIIVNIQSSLVLHLWRFKMPIFYTK